MMAAYRLRGLGWFGACAAMVLGFYLVSLQVAGERNRLEALNRQIRTAERDIRALETEFDTRANLQQLERWNGDILALSAPTAGQFVRDAAQLASIRFDSGAPLGQAGEVRTAALVVPSLPAAAPVAAPPAAMAAAPAAALARPVIVAHTATRAPAPTAKAAPARAVKSAPAQSARLTAKPAAKAAPPTRLAAGPPVSQASARTQRVAMLDGALLSDLASSARTEASRR